MPKKNQHLIKRIEDIEKQLKELKLEVAADEPKKKASNKLAVGQEVRVLNPKKGQGTKGPIVRINYGTRRATVQTEKGNVSRTLSNLKRTEPTSDA